MPESQAQRSRRLLDARQMDRVMRRMAGEIIEHNQGAGDLILVGIRTQAEWIQCKAPLEALGYDYAEHAGVPEHFIFGRGRNRGERTHLVHVVEYGSTTWRDSLAFRDALRTDKSLAAQYQALKEQASAQVPEGRGAYTVLKGPFVAAVIAGAGKT